MLLTFLEKLPLSQGGKVFVGTSLCLAICAYPVIRKRRLRSFSLLSILSSNVPILFPLFSPSVSISIERKTGHDLFSSERPQDIVDQEVKARREKLNIE